MQTADDSFERRLEALDLGLFDNISSQSLEGDRRSWLAVQRSVRRTKGYTYLEIGSHLGGSIQQHLIDPLCRGIVSIDKRTSNHPNDSGRIENYQGNSTARMLDNLRQMASDDLSKVICFDLDAKDLDPNQVPEPVDFCLIDGEHTHSAVLSDFDFCLQICSPDAAICFHDAPIVHRALGAIVSSLQSRRIPFTARRLGGYTFGIFLRNCAAAHDPYIRRCSHGGLGWLRLRRVGGFMPLWLRALGGASPQ